MELNQNPQLNQISENNPYQSEIVTKFEMVEKLINRMPRQIQKINNKKFESYKYEIVSMLVYLREDVFKKVGASNQTFWLSTLYLRQAIAKGKIDPGKTTNLMLGTLICMSLAIKYNESGPQMQTYHAPNRYTKHLALFEILKLTILSEQR